MRKVFPWLLLLLAVILAFAVTAHHLRPDTLPATDSAAALGLMLLEDESGIYVLAVNTGSAAEKAGIEPGDRITQVQGETVIQAAALDEYIAREKRLSLTVQRGSRNMQIEIPLR